MRLKLKEDPKEWRKVTLLTALALALLSTLLRWRKVMPAPAWLLLLVLLALMALTALVRPQWFRGFYRASSRVGFFLAQWIGRGLLLLVFLLVLTPLGLVLRLLGKDLLRLNRHKGSQTYWTEHQESGRLDRLF